MRVDSEGNGSTARYQTQFHLKPEQAPEDYSVTQNSFGAAQALELVSNKVRDAVACSPDFKPLDLLVQPPPAVLLALKLFLEVDTKGTNCQDSLNYVKNHPSV